MRFRRFVGLASFLPAVACHHVARCGTCGMKIDEASPWLSYAVVDGVETPFDTPRCAMQAWRSAPTRLQAARFREYYSHALVGATELRFVAGSDVVGPMGADLVPVAIDKASRFARDHNGAPPQSAEEVVEGGLP